MAFYTMRFALLRTSSNGIGLFRFLPFPSLHSVTQSPPPSACTQICCQLFTTLRRAPPTSCLHVPSRGQTLACEPSRPSASAPAAQSREMRHQHPLRTYQYLPLAHVLVRPIQPKYTVRTLAWNLVLNLWPVNLRRCLPYNSLDSHTFSFCPSSHSMMLL